MPEPIETSSDIGGAGQFFKQVEGWLNDPDPVKRKANRAAARGRVANNFAGVGTTTLAGNQGINHFNKHWRHMGGGTSGRGWWPNVTAARVNSQMSGAFVVALAPANDTRDIRLRWDCRELNLNAGDSSFSATATPSGGAVWVDIRSPRAPGNVLDPATGRKNYGYSASSDLPPAFAGPFTPLAALEVANYDGIAGADSSFDNALGSVTENNGFRESWSFFPIDDPVVNASQKLVGLTYTRDSWRRVGSGEDETFAEVPLHSETGYLLWDEEHSQAYRVIAMPRGVTVLAVAQGVLADATEVTFEADTISEDPFKGGILSNPLLAESARTVSFTSTMTIIDYGTAFSYKDTAQQQRADTEGPISHTDENTLVRV